MCFLLQIAQGFNGADLRNVCTEAGMAAIRAERDYVIHEDFMKVSSFSEEAIFVCINYVQRDYSSLLIGTTI